MGNPIQIDDKKFLRKMKKYEAVVGKEVNQLVYNAARLCAIECAKYTAPRGMNTDAKRNGEAAVTKGMRGIFTTVNPQWWKEVINMGKNKREILRHTKTGIIWARDTQETIDSLEGAKAWHKSNKQNGRAKRLGLLDRAIIKKSIYTKLLRETVKKVGISKAGWGIVATECKADVREPLRGIPAWVKSKIPKANGAVKEMKRNGLGFAIQLNNQVRYARETLDTNSESFAVNLAKKKMISMMNKAIRYEKAKEAQLAQ